jgi:hypothetical protein
MAMLSDELFSSFLVHFLCFCSSANICTLLVDYVNYNVVMTMMMRNRDGCKEDEDVMLSSQS